MLQPLHIVGLMTGNSMDAVDAALTRFDPQGGMEDIAFHSIPFPASLFGSLQTLREALQDNEGDALALAADPRFDFTGTHDAYMALLAQAVRELIQKAPQNAPDLIGLHGQTLAHFPPSMLAAGREPCTVQIGDGQRLADLLGLPVVYDFRSDDLMQGGEGAPLAPAHNRAMTRAAQQKGYTRLAFCNAGNTGNIALTDGKTLTGWDTGPFNFFSDRLCRQERGAPCDKDGLWGAGGQIDPALLSILFERSARTRTGANYYELLPPKSADGALYAPPSELDDPALPFEIRLRTAQYFAAYLFFHSLSFVPQDASLPEAFALFGGGWRNPVCLGHFRDLLAGRFEKAPLLPQHRTLFSALHARLPASVFAEDSGFFGFDGAATEARLFAHAALAHIKGEPFSFPETTGCAAPVKAGLLRLPRGAAPTPRLASWLAAFQTPLPPLPPPLPATDFLSEKTHDPRLSRAVKGWRTRA